MDSEMIEVQELTTKILKQIDETPTASYHIIIGALALALVTAFMAIKEDYGLQAMKKIKTDFYTFLSNATRNEETAQKEDLN